MLNKVIGMISWFPDDERRASRINQVQKTFIQLGELFPTIPIIVIAQNWKDATFTINSKAIIYRYDKGLGILGARKELRIKFFRKRF